MANDLDRTRRHEEEPSDFYIPATRNLHDGRVRTLKSGDGFALLDRNGDALSGPDGVLGFYWRDTRHLTRLDLEIDGRGEVGVILLEPPEFRHFARVRAARRRRTFPHKGDITTRATEPSA